MAATKRKRAKIINYMGFERNGAKVIAQTQDGERFKVRCGCSVVFDADRDKLRRSRNPGRMLQCYDCACKCAAAGARMAAATRSRTSGRFAPGFEEV